MALLATFVAPQLALAANPDVGGQTWAVAETVGGPVSEQMHRNVQTAMAATAVKFYLGGQYGGVPVFVDHAIADGAKVIILRTEAGNCFDWGWTYDCLNPNEVEYELTGRTDIGGSRTFWDLVLANPNIMFYLEVGNEPNVSAGFSADQAGMETYRDRINQIYDQLTDNSGTKFLRDNFRWLASMPTPGDDVNCDDHGTCEDLVRYALQDGSVLNRYDGLALHTYTNGWLEGQDDEFTRWRRIYEYAWGLNYGWSHPDSRLRGQPVKIAMTEVGICDPWLDKTEKAQRYNDWIRDGNMNHEDRVIAITFWTTSQDARNCASDPGSGLVVDRDGDGIAGEYPFEQGYTLEAAANGHDDQAEELAKRYQTPDENGSLDYHYYSQTGYAIRGKFDHHWWIDGGLGVFGFPISAEFEAADGIRRQYTERQVFEYHPKNFVPSWRYEIEYERLGAERAAAFGYTSRPEFQSKPAISGCDYFNSHNLCDTYGFKTYWHSYGRDLGMSGIDNVESIQLFGYPISEGFTDPETGLHVQYFERAVFEYHPENPAGQQVLLRRLGHEKMTGVF